jgi:hypothetical protein
MENLVVDPVSHICHTYSDRTHSLTKSTYFGEDTNVSFYSISKVFSTKALCDEPQEEAMIYFINMTTYSMAWKHNNIIQYILFI